MADFPGAVEAVDCDNEIQHEPAKHNSQLAEHCRAVSHRHQPRGVIGQQDGTIYGDGVNVAAKIQQFADSRGVRMSGTAFNHVKGKLPLQFKFIVEQTAKILPDIPNAGIPAFWYPDFL